MHASDACTQAFILHAILRVRSTSPLNRRSTNAAGRGGFNIFLRFAYWSCIPDQHLWRSSWVWKSLGPCTSWDRLVACLIWHSSLACNGINACCPAGAIMSFICSGHLCAPTLCCSSNATSWLNLCLRLTTQYIIWRWEKYNSSLLRCRYRPPDSDDIISTVKRTYNGTFDHPASGRAFPPNTSLSDWGFMCAFLTT